MRSGHWQSVVCLVAEMAVILVMQLAAGTTGQDRCRKIFLSCSCSVVAMVLE